jgi:hypothetical protein
MPSAGFRKVCNRTTLRQPSLATRIVPLDTATPIMVPGLSIIAQHDSSLSPIARKLLEFVQLEIAKAGAKPARPFDME